MYVQSHTSSLQLNIHFLEAFKTVSATITKPSQLLLVNRLILLTKEPLMCGKMINTNPAWNFYDFIYLF